MKAQVLLPKVFNFSFTYNTKKEKLLPGDIVEVPFGKNKEIGVPLKFTTGVHVVPETMPYKFKSVPIPKR